MKKLRKTKDKGKDFDDLWPCLLLPALNKYTFWGLIDPWFEFPGLVIKYDMISHSGSGQFTTKENAKSCLV